MTDFIFRARSGREYTFYPADVLVAEQEGENVRVEVKGLAAAVLVKDADVRDFAEMLHKSYGGVTKTWKVYGAAGHRQRESFFPSVSCNFSTEEEPRLVTVLNADSTWTNEYTEIVITCSNTVLAEAELAGQITDGVFENSRTGEIVEVVVLE